MEFSQQEIESLAPDASSVSSGRGLSKPSSWLETGEEDGYLWGLCKGSGSRPYQVRVDASQPEIGFKCSCPSRKIPCKHVLGLLFLRAANGGPLGGECPDWAKEWREKRRQRQAGGTAKTAGTADGGGKKSGQKGGRKSASFAERVEAHLPLMTEGMDVLYGRMIDAVRHGVEPAWLQDLSRRLVDTQLSGPALVLEKMEKYYGERRDEASLARLTVLMGRLLLLVEAFRGRDSLSEAERHDLFLALGVTLDKEQVLAGGARRGGIWQVLGVALEDFGRIRERRVWLGNADGETALIQEYVPRNKGVSGVFAEGSLFAGELAFYPGTVRQRALPTENFAPAPEAETPPLPETALAVRRTRDMVNANPWLWRWPLSFSGVRVRCDGEGAARIVTADGRVMPVVVSCAGPDAWAMHALSLTGPVNCFGEWNGSAFVPLRVWREGALAWVREDPVDTFL